MCLTKWYDGKVNFANLDLSRCEEIEVDKGRMLINRNLLVYVIIGT